jgi:hypothetical protein
MEKYLSHFGLKARNNAWPYRTSPYAEHEFEPFTRIELIDGPKLYYSNPRKVVRFRIEGGTQDYFAEWKHFKEHTI